MTLYEGKKAKLAMDRMTSFWRREFNDRILVAFEGRSSQSCNNINTHDNEISAESPALGDYPKMLEFYENMLSSESEGDDCSEGEIVYDDSLGIPIIAPDRMFGCGLTGTIFGGNLHLLYSGRSFRTWNDPVVMKWDDVENLVFDEKNKWLQACLGLLDYLAKNMNKIFCFCTMHAYEGANFIVSMRGTTQAFFDLIDNPPGLEELYEVGYKAAVRFHELKLEIIRPYNEKIFGNKEFCDIAPLHAVPSLDTDAYGLCSPEIFGNLGRKYKQKIIDRFGGARFWIHSKAQHITPIVGSMNNITVISFLDDPGLPGAFNRINEFRRLTYDTPLEMSCSYKELVEGLKNWTLPGGINYYVDLTGRKDISISELNDVMENVRNYRACNAAKPEVNFLEV